VAALPPVAFVPPPPLSPFAELPPLPPLPLLPPMAVVPPMALLPPATQMTSDLSGFLDKLIANAPDAMLVVAQIIPLGYGTNDVIKAYNQAIPGLVQQRAAAGKHVVLLDMYTGFNASTMLGSDSIHPNSTGYKFMADHWYTAIGSLLPK